MRRADERPGAFHFLSQPQSTATVSEEVRAELLRRSGENLRRLAALLEEGAGGTDPRVVADVVWSAFVGLIMPRWTLRTAAGTAATYEAWQSSECASVVVWYSHSRCQL